MRNVWSTTIETGDNSFAPLTCCTRSRSSLHFSLLVKRNSQQETPVVVTSSSSSLCLISSIESDHFSICQEIHGVAFVAPFLISTIWHHEPGLHWSRSMTFNQHHLTWTHDCCPQNSWAFELPMRGNIATQPEQKTLHLSVGSLVWFTFSFYQSETLWRSLKVVHIYHQPDHA